MLLAYCHDCGPNAWSLGWNPWMIFGFIAAAILVLAALGWVVFWFLFLRRVPRNGRDTRQQ